MISPYQFNLLTHDEKSFLIFNEGNFIDDRTENDLTILLYKLFAFYVEVFYQAGIDDIQTIRTFSDNSVLKPYLEKVKYLEVSLSGAFKSF